MKKLLPIVLTLALCSTASAVAPSSGNSDPVKARLIGNKDTELRQDVRAVERATGDLHEAKSNLRNAETRGQKQEAREDVKDAKNDLQRASRELREDLNDRKNGNGGGPKPQQPHPQPHQKPHPSAN